MITRTLFEQCFPIKGLTSAKNLKKYNLVRERITLIYWLNVLLPKYNINNFNRVTAFLGTCGVETDYFKTSVEYASGADYEFRKDLGNIFKGDGKRYKGGSLIQTTGRYNFWRVMVRFLKVLTGVDHYRKLADTNFKAYLASPDYDAMLKEADRLNINFLETPDILRLNIKNAVEAACIFWQENNLNKYADAGRYKELNGFVNRGDAKKQPLHWDKRWELYLKLRTLIPKDISFEVQVEEPVVEPAPVAPVETEAPTEAQPIDLDKAQVSIDKAQATLQNPAVKTIAKRAGGRLAVGLSTVWSTTGGKVALILTSIVIAGVLAGVIYSYRKQIQLGFQIAKATVKKWAGGLF